MAQSVTQLRSCLAIKEQPQDLKTGWLVLGVALLTTVLCCLYVCSSDNGCYCPYLYNLDKGDMGKDWASLFQPEAILLAFFTTDLYSPFSFPVQKINSQPLPQAQLPPDPSARNVLWHSVPLIQPRFRHDINLQVIGDGSLEPRSVWSLTLAMCLRTAFAGQRPSRTFPPELDTVRRTRAVCHGPRYF